MLRQETTLDALLAIRERGGEYGITLRDFSRFMWPDRPGAEPKRGGKAALNRGAGRVLVDLTRLGLAMQWGASGRARYTLTEAGETFLRERSPLTLRRAPTVKDEWSRAWGRAKP